ncbi:AAA family ATPase [Parabacteroides timonensis]|uniref:AAA family ATPase n=1 Tax=Parabacteroides timonensis TaxID=1871013 RepID=UPI00094F2AAB|nr:AAA family ATPase [Parabacteroides timonensis]
MIRKLIIRNFGAIKSADIDLKDYNVFIGEQGSGKSTIAKLITIFEENATNLFQDKGFDLKPLFEEYNIASYFNSDTYIHYIGESVTISYLQGKFDFAISEGQAVGEREQIKSLYIPAERFFVSTFSRSLATLVLNKAPIPDTLLKFASIYEKAKKKYPDYNVPIFNLLFQTNNSNETLLLKDSDKTIPFKDASSGMQSVIPLLMVLDYAVEEKEYSRFVVEEPELNLFPQTQVKLLHQMIGKCKKLTITTHSPYLLSAFNNLIEANNVLNADISKAAEVYKLVPQACVLDFDNVGAYKIEGGEVLSILDKEYRLIVADQIDSVADQESRIFSELLALEV